MKLRTLFRIVDATVASAVVLGSLTYIGVEVIKSKKNFEVESEQYLNDLKDEFGHIPSVIKGQAPTETAAGFTSSKKCLLCGEVYDGPYEIPMLTDECYNRTFENSGTGVKVTWFLKDEYIPTLGALMYSKEYEKGCITIGGVNYLAHDFNKTFTDMEMTYEEGEESSTITINVTKRGGTALIGKTIKCPLPNTNLKITGEQLEIIAPTNDDTINVDTKTSSITIENQLNIHTENYTNVSSKSCVVANHITIGENAILKASNLQYAIYSETGVDVNGELFVSGTTSAIYNISGKYVKFPTNRNLFVNEEKKTVTNQYAYSNCGKHLIVCKQDRNIDVALMYKFKEVSVTPTEATTGEAIFTCSECGTERRFELPALTDPSYEIDGTTVIVDGQPTGCNCYKYTVPGIHADKAIVDKRDEFSNYIKVGDAYYTVNGWSTAFPKATAAENNNVFTITLSGDTEITGSVDLTIFDKVIFAGSGTFKITTNQTSALLTKALEVGYNVTLDLEGTNCAKTTYTTDDRDGLFDAIVASSSLLVKGRILIDNFYVGIFTNGTCNVNADAKIEFTKTVYGFYSNAELTFTSNGIIKFTNTASSTKGSSSIAFLTYRAKNTWHFTGNSETTIKTGYEGFGTPSYSDTSTSNNITIRVSENAKLDVITDNSSLYSYGLSNIANFIVENTDQSQCNATVSITTDSAHAINFFTGKDVAHSLIINTTGNVTFWKDGSKISQYGVNINAGKYDIKIASKMTIKDFGTGFYFAKSNVTINSAVCDHNIVLDKTASKSGAPVLFGGTVPASITDAWLYTE